MSPEDMGKTLNGLMNEEHADEPFEGVTAVVQDAGSSSVRLMTTVGIIVVTIALIIAGLKIASLNRRKREEGKEKLLAVIIAAIVLFSLASVFLLVLGMADQFMK